MSLTLRAIERSDLLQLQLWRNSDGILPYVREYRILSMEDQEEWFQSYRKHRRNIEWGQELMILEFNGTPIGVAGFVRIQWKNRLAELSFYIGEESYRHPENITGSLKLLLSKGFWDFGFHKITWPIYSHDPNLAIYKQVLREEAVLREEYYAGGKMRDRHYLSLMRTEYQQVDLT